MFKVSQSDIDALRKSGAFDEKWYLEQYPDVKLLGIEPAVHYLWIGSTLKRRPSPDFNGTIPSPRNTDFNGSHAAPALEHVRALNGHAIPHAPTNAPAISPSLQAFIVGARKTRVSNFNSAIAQYIHESRGNKIAVYTAIFGNYDYLTDPEYTYPDADYICYTDRDDITSRTYRILKVPPIFQNATLNCRMVKVLSHIFLRNYETSLWIDGSTRIRGTRFKDTMSSMLRERPLAVHKHFQRNCVYAEATECIAQKKDDSATIERQMKAYKNEGYPPNAGLVETAQVFRTHNSDIERFNEYWWSQIRDHSTRDQLSFNYTCWKLGFQHATLDGCQWLDSNFKNYFHLQNGFETLDDTEPVTLVMLVRNALEMTKKSISSIMAKTHYKNFDLIVVDNDSDEETKKYLREAAKKHTNITIVTNKENRSFSAANNQAAALSKSDYLLFINNDVEAIDPCWLKILVHELRANPHLGAVGPILLYPDYKIQSAGINVRQEGDSLKVPAEERKHYSHPTTVDALTGGCLLVRKSIHDAIGGFDERFFYGQEDIDYCLKIRELGKSLKLASQCELLHHESHTRRFTSRTLRNREIIKRKWKGRIEHLSKKTAAAPKKGMSYGELLSSRQINYRTISDMLLDIKRNTHMLPEKIDLVVGIPRSGMLPAYMIGQIKNCPVLSLDELVRDVSPTRGDRPLHSLNNHELNVLVIDDSINFGNSHKRVRSLLKKTYMGTPCSYTFLAVYASENWLSDEVLSIARCNLPRLFQWNYTNHGISQYACYDLDGVLCVDPTEQENDDGKIYESFILSAAPLYIPLYRIKAIVTSRLEKYRALTEQWLKANNVKYEKLYMLNLPTKEERIRLNAHAKFKAEIYSSLKDTHLFVESNISQAQEIAKLTKKPTICTANDMMY